MTAPIRALNRRAPADWRDWDGGGDGSRTSAWTEWPEKSGACATDKPYVPVALMTRKDGIFFILEEDLALNNSLNAQVVEVIDLSTLME